MKPIETDRKTEYQKYLQSEHWQSIRREMLEYYNNTCVICGSHTDLNVHHLHYHSIGCESTRDLVVVCKDCHEWLHNLNGTVKMATQSFEDDLRSAYMQHLEPIIEKHKHIVCWQLAVEIHQRMGNRPNKYMNTAVSAIITAAKEISDHNWPEHLISGVSNKNPWRIVIGDLAFLRKTGEDMRIVEDKEATE